MQKLNTYEEVTNRIIAALEGGIIPWQKPWASTGLPANLATRKEYRGFNIIMLSFQPFSSRWWVTYKQAQALGGSVRKGEKSSIVTFWRVVEPKEGDEDQETRLILKHYNVFNVEQCDGLTVPDETAGKHDHQPLAACEAIVDGMPKRPEIILDGQQAYYSPRLDHVGMPDISQFTTAEAYYATLFHELIHATGHESRLNRFPADKSPAPFGSPDYSKEELVAEFGAAYLAAVAGIFPRTAENSVAYIQGWIKALRSDKRLLPVAAAQAQKAADFILPQPTAEEKDSETE